MASVGTPAARGAAIDHAELALAGPVIHRATVLARAAVGVMNVAAGAGRRGALRHRQARRLGAQEAHLAELARRLAAFLAGPDAHAHGSAHRYRSKCWWRSCCPWLAAVLVIGGAGRRGSAAAWPSRERGAEDGRDFTIAGRQSAPQSRHGAALAVAVCRARFRSSRPGRCSRSPRRALRRTPPRTAAR